MAVKKSNASSIQIAAGIKTPPKVKVACGCIYGDVGMGKTHLLCTAAEYFDPARVLIISLDREDETLSKFAEKGIKVLDLIKVAPVSKGAVDIHSANKELLKYLRTQGQYDFVGYDSVSKLSALQRMLSIAERDGGDIPEQRDYGVAQNRVVEFMWSLRNAAILRNFHLFITAWEKDEWIDQPESAAGGYSRWFPDLPPEMGRLLRHDWSFIGRMQASRSNVNAGSKGATINTQTKYTTELVFNAKASVGKDRVGFPGTVKQPTIKLLLDGRYDKKGDEKKDD